MIVYGAKYQMNFYEKLKYIFRVIGRAFVISVAIFFLLLFTYLIIYFGDQFLGIKVGTSKMPMFGAYVIVSPSMVPTINVNDGVVVQRIEQQNSLNIGDVITFSSRDIDYEGLTITHRIVGKQIIQSGELVYRTKGDNNIVEDSSLVKFSDIYGKVVMKIPMIGYIYNFLTTPFGFIISIIIPILIIFACNIYRVIMNFSK